MNAYDPFSNDMKVKPAPLLVLHRVAYDSCNFFPPFLLIYTFSLLIMVSINFNKNGMNGMQLAKSIVKSMVCASYHFLKMMCASYEIAPKRQK